MLNKNCYNSQCPYNDNDFEACRKDQAVQMCEQAIISEDGRIKSTAYYLKVLRSPECACGKYKQEKRAFCYGDWRELPNYMQLCLKRKVRDGFEEAYEDALQHLQNYVW